MTDMTIASIRTTLLRVPWPDTPWLKGHAFGDARNLLVLEAETKGGIVGMGYLFSFRPGLKTVAAAIEETIEPRVIGKDATAVEAIWNDLWKATATYGRGGIVTMAQSALDIAL
jgi:L-alanine-DL-glutamate epimerase-like enolase superfamily enzyme